MGLASGWARQSCSSDHGERVKDGEVGAGVESRGDKTVGTNKDAADVALFSPRDEARILALQVKAAAALDLAAGVKTHERRP